MPIPKYDGSPEKEWISKCMSEMPAGEYDQDQALAICYKQMENMEQTKLTATPGKHSNLPENPSDHDVHHGATSDKAKELVKPKGIGADENPKNKKPAAPAAPALPQKKATMSAFEKNKLDFQVKLAMADLRSKGIYLAEEGGGSYPWEDCIADQIKQYGDEETANKVCGAIKAQYGS
jgi:hypothetical protein